ncbi:MAG TPA: hypothetical protein VF228_23155 [Iamia sp.]
MWKAALVMLIAFVAFVGTTLYAGVSFEGRSDDPCTKVATYDPATCGQDSGPTTSTTTTTAPSTTVAPTTVP